MPTCTSRVRQRTAMSLTQSSLHPIVSSSTRLFNLLVSKQPTPTQTQVIQSSQEDFH
ncbi:predicted protein [Sclerotinia sclerotiorum 1980 UF-70]|uniref:Uncharacterized protein n=1 Tax=Sclerotinia sclerotiorum (strain ATCC 18683 / 1980 / Ss-1) TaxID=665079 RepID=A7E962_SCLS1|nr:predicted protein [Sclerotinia sclerotiorum 1980 UF-70]EDN96914.1 predicted protein [Sclerotinia sclerotiorum 1980 UF-70]